MLEDWNGIIAWCVLLFGAVLGWRLLKRKRHQKRDHARRIRDELRQRGT